MSRGLGKLQRDIRDHVTAIGRPTTFETMRWALFEGTSAIRADTPDRRPAELRNGRLPASWNSSMSRALAVLAADDHGIRVEYRRLASIGEMVKHYPGKSLIAATRQLRIGLLPGLAAIDRRGDDTGSYTKADNESWYLRKFGSEKMPELQAAWQTIEPKLVKQLTQGSKGVSDDLIYLIVRGMELFRSRTVTCSQSIGELVEALVKSETLPSALCTRLSALAESIVPQNQVGSLSLKSFIRGCVEITRTGRNYRLKDATLDALEDTCPDIVRALPGYKTRPAKSKISAFDMYFSGPRSVHGPEIHKLVDKSVFVKFVFLEPA
jgi:hypothetical protein